MNQRCIIQRWFVISAVSDSDDSRIFTFEYEYLREFETEFENILGCESGAHMGSMNQGPIWGQFMKKTRGKKSRATVPLTGCLKEFRSHTVCILVQCPTWYGAKWLDNDVCVYGSEEQARAFQAVWITTNNRYHVMYGTYMCTGKCLPNVVPKIISFNHVRNRSERDVCIENTYSSSHLCSIY